MKYKSFLVFLFFSCLVCIGSVTALTGEQIIRKVDANMTYGSARMEAKMVIHVRDQVRTKKMISYAEGRDRSYAEFTYPARDKGVKYLKIGDNMWMYLPSVNKIIKIAGHMLRQSMMGSDFSYEDALESDKLLEKYTIKLAGQDESNYILDLTAKVKKVTYYRRKIWIDKAIFVPVKEELFARSGKKLKVMTLGKVKKYGKRYYPTYMSMKNILRKDSKTEMFVEKAEFNVKLPARIFTKGNLTK